MASFKHEGVRAALVAANYYARAWVRRRACAWSLDTTSKRGSTLPVRRFGRRFGYGRACGGGAPGTRVRAGAKGPGAWGIRSAIRPIMGSRRFLQILGGLYKPHPPSTSST